MPVVAVEPLTVDGRQTIQPGDRIDQLLDERTLATLVRLGQARLTPESAPRARSRKRPADE